MFKRFLFSMLFGLGLLCVMGCMAEIAIMTNGHAELEEREAVTEALVDVHASQEAWTGDVGGSGAGRHPGRDARAGEVP